MEAGFAREEVTPPLGTPLLGTGESMQRLCDRINDPLYVRVLSLRQGEQEALIVGADFCFFGRDVADRLKGALGRELGLLPRQVLLNTSHTHSAPAVSAFYDMRYVPPLYDYLDRLEAALLRAARQAAGQRRAITLHAGMARSRVPMNRRARRPNGAIENAPNPAGPVLDSLPLCLLRDREGQPVCLLLAASTHPVCMRDKSTSADYPGVAQARLDEHLGRPCSLFLQGAGCGDSRPALLSLGEQWNFASDWKEATAVGEALAAEAIAALPSLSGAIEPQLATALVEARFPFRPLSRGDYEAVLGERIEQVAAHNTTAAQRYEALRRRWAQRQLELLARSEQPRELPLQFQGVQLGRGVRLAAIEAETMAAHGQALEVAWGASDGAPQVTFALGYSNGDGIYLVTTAMLAEGGYEVDSYWEFGHPAPLAPGIEPIVADAAAQLQRAGIG